MIAIAAQSPFDLSIIRGENHLAFIKWGDYSLGVDARILISASNTIE